MGRPKGRGNYEYFVDEDGFMHCPVDDCSFKSSKSVPVRDALFVCLCISNRFLILMLG